MTFIDVCQRHRRAKDAEFELQDLCCEADAECSVVHRVEEEDTGQAQEEDGKRAQIASPHAPDRQEEEQVEDGHES